MLVRLRAGVFLPWFAWVAGCGHRAVPAAAMPESPPAPIPIAASTLYIGERGQRARASDPGEICKIDPEACPSLDMDREAARSYREPLYAVSQSDSKQSAGGPEILLTGPLAGAPAVRSVRYGYVAEADEGGGGATPEAPPPPSPIPVKPAQAARVEQFDIEAKVRIEVTEIGRARRVLGSLLEQLGGRIMNEAVEDGTNQRGASLSLRVPSKNVRVFLANLGDVGKVRSSTLETREVSRSISDAEVVQRNLEQALSRYEQLLAKAANVTEATALEGALMRVRTQLDRVRSDLAWAKDRVARSTVYVTLALEPSAPAFEPLAKFYPGARAVLLLDVPPSSDPAGTRTFAGGGISLMWPRSFDVDLDLMNDLTQARGTSVDFYSITLGTAFYSDYLGGGKRRSLNPYFGFRTGYAHAPQQSLFSLGGVLGLELVKSELWLLSLEARAYGLVGRKSGPDFALQPGIGLNVAY